MKAYSSSCYIQVITKNDIFANLFCGKVKVVHLKKISIPRLELLSCVLLAKLLKNEKNAVNKNFEKTNIFIGEILKLVYTGSGALKRSGINRQKIELMFFEIVQIRRLGIMFLQK